LNRKKLQEFESKYMPVTESGCWLWIGACKQGGYGQFWLNGKKQLAHRAAYEFYRGQIPDGLTLDHLCCVTCCVNPWHLEPVSVAENTRRAGRRLTHCKRGHRRDANNIRIDCDGRWQCRACDWVRELRRHRSKVERGVWKRMPVTKMGKVESHYFRTIHGQ
jgi:hypothetical protein